MIYTLFFSRLRQLSDESAREYQERLAALRERARTEFPGFVDQKSFTSEDGERLTVVRFEDRESLNDWSADAEHREGKRRGRREYYQEYRVVVCEELRERTWTRETEEP